MSSTPKSEEEAGPRYVRNPDTVTRRIAGETFIVSIRRELANMDRLYVLDSVSERIWELLDGHRTLANIAKTLVEEFDVDLQTAHADLVEFVAELEGVGLIERRE